MYINDVAMRDFIEVAKLKDVAYLGDGLYAGTNSGRIILAAERGERVHWVCLEDFVLARFLGYVEDLKNECISNEHVEAKD